MTKFYALLFAASALFCMALPAYAQSEFRPGYVVRTTGDTLRGSVEYRGAQRSARICRFRPSEAAAIERFGPSQLRAYGFPQGKAYESRVLPATDSAGWALPLRTLFMEVLAAGPATLYYRLDEGGQNHFYLTKATEGPVTELVYKREPVTENGSTHYRENNRYRGTLGEAFASCPAVQQQVAGLVFTMRALTEVVQKYNACARPGLGTGTGASLAARDSRLKLGLLVGAESSRLVFDNPETQLVGSINSSPAPVVGLSFQYALPALSERLALRIEALIERQSYTDEINTATYYFGYNRADVQVKATYLRVPLLLRYSFPVGRLRPFMQIGATSAVTLNKSQQLRFLYTANGGQAYTDTRPISNSSRSYEIAAVASLGLQLPPLAGRALQVEARTERGGGLFATGDFDNPVWRYFLLLGYSLSK